jgi:sec-independent protein translocase protein TatA
MDMVSTLAFIDGLGAPEMVLIFVLVLVLFGGQKLPEFARGLGKTMREFKKAAAGVEEEFKKALEEDERKNAQPQLTAAPPPASDPGGPEAAVHSPVTQDDVPTDSYHDEYHDHYDSPETPAPAEEEKKILPPPPAVATELPKDAAPAPAEATPEVASPQVSSSPEKPA